MSQRDYEFIGSGRPAAHHHHNSPPSHLSRPAHSTAPVFSASISHASMSSSRMGAHHAPDSLLAAVAQEQHFSQNLPHTQGQHAISTPNGHRYSYTQVPEMTDNAGRLETIYPCPPTGGMYNNGADVDLIPMTSNDTITHMDVNPYPNPPYFKDHGYNYNMVQGTTQSYNPTQANAGLGLPATPRTLGSSFSSYSHLRYACYHRYMSRSFAHGVLEICPPSSHIPHHGSYQSLQNTTIYSPHMLPPPSASGSHHRMQQRPNSTDCSSPAGPHSRIRPNPLMPYPPSTFRPQLLMEQRQNPTNHSSPVDPRSIEPGIPMPHPPSAFEPHPYRNHEGRINQLPPPQTHRRSSLHRHTSRNYTQEAAQLISQACRWRLGDNVFCNFVGSQKELKAHISSAHLSGPQGGRLECRWEACHHHGRGQSADGTMRRDSIWRHVQERHLGVKYRKKPPSDHR